MGGEEFPRGCQRVFPGSHVVPRWALRFPAPQWEPAASPGPRHRQRSQPLALIEERQELAANDFGAGRKAKGSARAKARTVLPAPPRRAGAPGVGSGGVGWAPIVPSGEPSVAPPLVRAVSSTGHDRTVTAGEAPPPRQPERGRGGVALPTPHWRSSAGAASSPREMPLSRESQGGSRRAVPSSSCPGSVTPAALPAQTRLTWKRQRWPSRARRSQPQGQDVGQEGPGPHRQHAGNGPSARQGKDLEKGTCPRIGAKRDGNSGSWGQPARQPGEHFCTLEPCGCGSHSSTSADPMTDGPGSTALGPAGAPEALAAVAAPGRWQGWRRAGCCRGAPSPRRAGCGAGPCFLH